MKQLLVLIALVPLACATSPLNVEDRSRSEPTSEVRPDDIDSDGRDVDPPGPPPDPADARTTTRNEGFGPYDALGLVCGSGEKKRCAMSEPVAVPSGSEVIAIASFTEGNDGRAHLAVQVRDGWYVSEVPDGEVFGMLSHHSPAGTWFDLKHVRPVGPLGFRVDRRYGMSSFIGGRGSDGSSSLVEVRRLACKVARGRVSCDERELIFSESCQTPMEGGEPACTRTGREPPPF